ncbi:MAG TPA: hypothetical protein VJQ82_27025 [Terriglobales bacterium]|nr:hypothetical protein [Terriglobales bacterium]
MRFLISLLFLCGTCACAQQLNSLPSAVQSALDADPAMSDFGALPDNPQPADGQQPTVTTDESASTKTPAVQGAPPEKQQPKRILGIMPNYRAVSAGAIPPPPTPKQAFKIATQNSFDYSSFVFVGLTSLIAEGSDAHPQLGKGVAGFGRYYWRGFLDKTDGNYLVIFALPTVFRQDERYYAMGEGGFIKRLAYSTSRILITPDYHGHDSFNASEILGRGIAQAVSISYYPSSDRTFGSIGAKYGYALLRDAATNSFREFWPDIATHVLHRHP